MMYKSYIVPRTRTSVLLVPVGASSTSLDRFTAVFASSKHPWRLRFRSVNIDELAFQAERHIFRPVSSYINLIFANLHFWSFFPFTLPFLNYSNDLCEWNTYFSPPTVERWSEVAQRIFSEFFHNFFWCLIHSPNFGKWWTPNNTLGWSKFFISQGNYQYKDFPWVDKTVNS